MADEEESKRYRCLCSLMHVRTGTIVLGLLEFLLIAHSLIFVCSTIASGEKRYENNNENFSKVIQFKFMLPTLIIQSIWIVSIILMLLGIKAINPYVTLPHFFLEILAVVYGVVLTVFFLVNVRKSHFDNISWELALVIALFLAVALVEVYFAIVSFYCFRFLVHQKTSVEAQKKISRFYTNNVSSANTKNRPKKGKDSEDSSSTDEMETAVKLPVIDNPIRIPPGPLRIPPARLPPVKENSLEDTEESTEYSGTSRMGSALPGFDRNPEQDRGVTEVTVEHGAVVESELDRSNGRLETRSQQDETVQDGRLRRIEAQTPTHAFFIVPKIYVEAATDADSSSETFSRPSTVSNGVIPQEARPVMKQDANLPTIREATIPNLPKVY